jgi:hypothetical protein
MILPLLSINKYNNMNGIGTLFPIYKTLFSLIIYPTIKEESLEAEINEPLPTQGGLG